MVYCQSDRSATAVNQDEIERKRVAIELRIGTKRRPLYGSARVGRSIKLYILPFHDLIVSFPVRRGLLLTS